MMRISLISKRNRPSLSLCLVDPRSLSLKSAPEGGMREDMSKVIICQTDEGGANPAVNITWRHLSPLGGAETLGEEMRATNALRMSSSGSGLVTQSNLTVLAHRRLNGHRIECSIEKPGRIALLRQSETLEVICKLSLKHYIKQIASRFCYVIFIITSIQLVSVGSVQIKSQIFDRKSRTP